MFEFSKNAGVEFSDGSGTRVSPTVVTDYELFSCITLWKTP
jgi:hypothetical protein